jgi:hypothetical protein
VAFRCSALAAAVGMSWSGNYFGVFILSCYIFCVGCPIALVLILVLWRINHRIALLGKRVALQVSLFCIALIPLIFVSSRVERYAENVGQNRGLDISVRIEKFKAAHGAYPETLDYLVRWDKMPLPQPPTDLEGWHYLREGDTYSLQFSGGSFQIFTFDAKHHVWFHD